MKPLRKERPVFGEELSWGADREIRFEQLFKRYSRPVTYFFSRRGFSAEECRDLTQETFLGVYRGMDRFRHESSVETWLFTIAANIWRNAIRNGKAEKRDAQEVSLETSQQEGCFELPAPSYEDPEEGLLERERVELLRATFDLLPPQMQRCLLLRVEQKLKYREIAEVMQISIQTVKSQLFQAKEALRRRLASHFPELDDEDDDETNSE